MKAVDRRSWVLPGICCVLAGALLAILSLRSVSDGDQLVVDLMRAAHEGLRHELEDLRSQKAPSCQAPGSHAALQPPKPSQIPAPHGPRPDQIEVAAPQRPGAGVETLSMLLDRTTVFVLTKTSSGFKTGSGFFIAPNRVLTNRHVIEDNVKVEVASRAIGRFLVASIVAVGAAPGTGRQDIALLEVTSAPQAETIRIGITPQRLANVTAAGFPGIVIEGAARHGIPETAFTQGVVASRLQQLPDDIETIFHTAVTAGGNSGGPLVDNGGCVVGMNSWGTTDVVDGVSHSSFAEAIDASELRKFLDANHVSYAAVNAACAPTRTLGRPSARAITQ